MGAQNLRIVLTDAEINKIKLARFKTYGITMAAPLASGGNAFITIDTTEGWRERLPYIPRNGEFAVYSDRRVIDGVNYPGVKIGDGTTYVADLPFLESDTAAIITNALDEHVLDTDIHITSEEREFWNNKVNLELDEENLIFTRQ